MCFLNLQQLNEELHSILHFLIGQLYVILYLFEVQAPGLFGCINNLFRYPSTT